MSAAWLPDLQVYAKSGTRRSIYADPGIVRDAIGRQLVIAVFARSRPESERTPFRALLKPAIL